MRPERMRAAMLALVGAVLAASPAAADFSACLAALRQAAVAGGVSRALAARALDLAKPDEKVLRASKVQPEFKTPIWDYMAFLVDEQRIVDGRAMLRRHDAALRVAEQRYGVDRHVIAAVWGIESDYGKQAGDYFLPHALATLACAGGARASFWRSELVAALSLVERGDLDLGRLRGSWAGAFGQTQFMPSTYMRHAVDMDGDGRRDLIASVPDALGSTANYLKRAGWLSGEPWLIEVRVPTGYAGPSGKRNRAPLAAWAQRGVVRADGAKLAGTALAGLLLPAGPRGPAFLVFVNFDAIYAYNHADSYALAISHLAHRLSGGPAFRTAWPTDDPGLSRAELVALQKLLLARGHAIGDADGQIGPLSSAAIAAEERRLGLPETGRAGRKIYRALGGT
jgi:lytic murein transglycosylase